MFSFHKPKIYRSNLGCCICKAKSSSSRFTDSKKYENEFENCFRIEEKRSGEICNACVLLVKRWKKLSPENRLTKHWHHVVDARAGPGTKLTSGRRVTASSMKSSGQQHADLAHYPRQSSSGTNRGGGVLPLSSSQANNQSSSTGAGTIAGTSSSSSASTNLAERTSKRTSTFSTNKARAIDTNVSTFTFGEPIRRSYMNQSQDHHGSSSYSSSSFGLSSATFGRPQSALSSSAFESVIKRFRQRQQQQQLEAQRRQLNKRQRASGSNLIKPDEEMERLKRNDDESPKQQPELVNQMEQQDKEHRGGKKVGKRIKRSSESIGSITVDGLRVSSLLDQTVWRKERICCGIIFRGFYNEVAVFPKLLKPCQCRVNKQKEQQIRLKQQQQQQSLSEDTQETQKRSSSPPPRATKSGSISSCDSSTSGTGSMEEPLAGNRLGVQPLGGGGSKAAAGRPPRRATKITTTTKVAKRPTRLPSAKRQLKKAADETDSIISSSSSGFSSTLPKTSASTQGTSKSICDHPQQQQLRSPSNSSSSSRLLLMADEEELDEEEEFDEEPEMMLDEEEEEFDEETEMMLDEEEEEEEVEEDSSVESLTGVERKKSAVAMA